MAASPADASVRAARANDAPALGALQSRAWRAAYVEVLPEDTLQSLAPDALAGPWREAVTTPPSPRHRVLAACAGPVVVGFSAFGPAGDPDLDPGTDAELHVLIVDPERLAQGHGSRLLAATVDTLRGDGFVRAYHWLGAHEDGVRAFLESTGWAADGAHRELDLRGDDSVVVRQLRLHTDVGLEP